MKKSLLLFQTIEQIFAELLQKNGEKPLQTTSALADFLGVSAAQLSRIKNGMSSIGIELMNKINIKIDKLEKDEEKRIFWKEQIALVQSDSRKEDSSVTSSLAYKVSPLSQTETINNSLVDIDSSFIKDETKEALDYFHEDFFETEANTKRIVCGAFRDMPQSTAKGRNPEYIGKSVSVIRNGLAFAPFQPFGPLEKIKDENKRALDKNDAEAADAWNYIFQLALGVHEAFEKTKQLLENEENKGQLVLYEAAKVPSLRDCNLHSRLYYSEQTSGQNRIRIIQLIIGKIGNGEYKEHYIECSTESALHSVIAEQFFPILHHWRKYSQLPIKKGGNPKVL